MAKRPSSWVNLQDYLGLNQEQGAEMGSRLASDVGAQASKAGTQITYADIADQYASGAGASASGYSGPNSLSDINAGLYGQVRDAASRVKNAQDPNMMGSEIASAYGGQAAGGAGGSALDAFLTGQTSSAALTGLQDSYGGLMNSLGIAENAAGGRADAGRAKSQQMGAAAAAAAAGAPEAGADSPTAWTPPGYKDLHAFMDNGSAGQYAHEAAMYASPADWITRGMGEAGYDGENVSQIFTKMFGANGNESGGTGDFSVGNLRSGARLVQDQYGPDALNAWFKSLTPESWKELMNKGNAGAQARLIRAWLQEHGYERLR